jgi:hypothetical protein
MPRPPDKEGRAQGPAPHNLHKATSSSNKVKTEDTRRGHGEWLWPAEGWPDGYGLLRCTVCSSTWVGPAGEECQWCDFHMDHAFTEPVSRRPDWAPGVLVCDRCEAARDEIPYSDDAGEGEFFWKCVHGAHEAVNMGCNGRMQRITKADARRLAARKMRGAA